MANTNKKYDDRSELRVPKRRPPAEKNRESTRIRLALRHGDLSVVKDEFDDSDNFAEFMTEDHWTAEDEERYRYG